MTPDILHRLLGGRPMRFVRFCFTDVVNGQPVNFYYDRFGRPWLAHHRWSLFRVTPNHGAEIWS